MQTLEFINHVNPVWDMLMLGTCPIPDTEVIFLKEFRLHGISFELFSSDPEVLKFDWFDFELNNWTESIETLQIFVLPVESELSRRPILNDNVGKSISFSTPTRNEFRMCEIEGGWTCFWSRSMVAAIDKLKNCAYMFINVLSSAGSPDSENGTMTFIRVKTDDPLYIYFHVVLHELLIHKGWMTLHASGLEKNGCGLLVIAPSGGGKSTLALALLRAGFKLVGEDRVLLRLGKKGVEAWAFPTFIKVTPWTFAQFHAFLPPSCRPPSRTSKAVIDPRSIDFIHFATNCRVEKIIFPESGRLSGGAECRRCKSWSQIVACLMESMVVTGSKSAGMVLEYSAALVDQCQAFRFTKGNTVSEIAPTILDVLNA